MEITVISQEENPMLHRTDVRFRVSHAEATPDRLAVRDSLAARLNKDANEVVIRKLDTKFGMRETVGEAKVYQGAEFAQDVEQAYMLSRNKIGADGGDAEDSSGDGEEPSAGAEPEAEPADAADEPEDAESADEEAESEAADSDEGDVEEAEPVDEGAE